MTTLQQISEQQADKATAVNENFEAVSVAGIFGINRETTTALTFGYYGGKLYVDGAATDIANGTVALTASSTNYIERTQAGVVSKNTTGFTASSIPLYTAVTGTVGISSITDYRMMQNASLGRISISISGSPTGYVLNAFQALADIINVSGAISQASQLIVPTVVRKWLVTNSTTGSPTQTVTVKTAAGNGVAVPGGSTYHLFCDGTDVVRVT